MELAATYLAACMKYQLEYPNDPKPFLTCTYRDRQEQDKLYEQGRTTPGPIVTNAKGGQSLHNFLPSHALDIAFIDSKGQLNWNKVFFFKFALLMKLDHHIQWGGDWKTTKDFPHFELKS